MHKSIFVPHGEFKIRTEGQVIISEIHGPWNVEMMRAWGQSFAPVAQALCVSGPVGSIGAYSHSLLTSPDSIALLGKLLRYGVEHYQVACTADVYDASVEGYVLGPRIFKSVYEGVVPSRSFARLADAVSWVNTVLSS
ncbi:MAG: hypothetical protein CFE44_05595 [Burkholderiales bacterium PBB4]|nr:MAG: hypothetical protein CFE44_05595 [Burkholderiales bacterium PBB4]